MPAKVASRSIGARSVPFRVFIARDLYCRTRRSFVKTRVDEIVSAYFSYRVTELIAELPNKLRSLFDGAARLSRYSERVPSDRNNTRHNTVELRHLDEDHNPCPQ